MHAYWTVSELLLNLSELSGLRSFNRTKSGFFSGLPLPIEDDADGRTDFRKRIHKKPLTITGDHVLLSVVAVHGAPDSRRKQRNGCFGPDLATVRAIANGNRHELAIQRDVK
jgi:hypothetical protein